MKEEPKEIKTVVAPVLVVEASTSTPTPEPASTVLDTQKIKKLILEAARLVTAEESAKVKNKIASEKPKSQNYLLVILLMVLFGLGAVILVLTLRQDLDFLVVSGAVFLLITSLTTSIFNIMKTDQTLSEAREANIKAQLALSATKETHLIVNNRIDEFKKLFMEREQERSKVAEATAYGEGRKDGRIDADVRTDKLAEKADKPKV